MRVRISSVPVLFYFWRCCVISNREHQINEEIRDKELRVIDVDGNQLGILSADEALKIAFEKDLDLVKIAPQATPPVCRIMDYGKFCFEQTKRAKEAKKNQKVEELLAKFKDAISEAGVVDKPSKMEGRSLVMFVSPKVNK